MPASTLVIKGEDMGKRELLGTCSWKVIYEDGLGAIGVGPEWIDRHTDPYDLTPLVSAATRELNGDPVAAEWREWVKYREAKGL